MLALAVLTFVLSFLSLTNAALLPYKRFANTSDAGVDVSGLAQSANAVEVNKITTLTSRVTVTFNPPSSTVWPSSVLFNSQVMVVAAEPTNTGAAGASPVTVYLPTTIYVTAPCAASAIASSKDDSETSGPVTNVVYQTHTSVLSSLQFTQPSIVAGNVILAASPISSSSSTLFATTYSNATVSVVSSSSMSSANSSIAQSTVHVTQTLHSTTTLLLPATTSSV